MQRRRDLGRPNVQVHLRIKPERDMDPSQEKSFFANEDGKPFFVDDKSEIHELGDVQVFDPAALNVHVHETIGKSMVEAALENRNTSVIMYGQTGTGKTHTMQGVRGDDGLVFRVTRELFRRAKEEAEQLGMHFFVELIMIEIYNNTVMDLSRKRNDPTTLKVREDPRSNEVSVEGARNVQCWTADDTCKAIKKNLKSRHVGGSMRNAYSSRSHAIYRLDAWMIPREKKGVARSPRTPRKMSSLAFVDLAGSEKPQAVDATEYESLLRQATAKEAGAINSSLFALARVLRAILSKQKKGGKGRIGYCPFRDSMLTRLLKPYLVGNCDTTLVGTVSLLQEQADETKRTIEFVQRAKLVRTYERPRGGSRQEELSFEVIANWLQKHKAELSREQKETLMRCLTDSTQAPTSDTSSGRGVFDAQFQEEELVEEDEEVDHTYPPHVEHSLPQSYDDAAEEGECMLSPPHVEHSLPQGYDDAEGEGKCMLPPPHVEHSLPRGYDDAEGEGECMLPPPHIEHSLPRGYDDAEGEGKCMLPPPHVEHSLPQGYDDAEGEGECILPPSHHCFPHAYDSVEEEAYYTVQDLADKEGGGAGDPPSPPSSFLSFLARESRVVGEGRFSTVYALDDGDSATRRCCKATSKSSSSVARECILNEISLMKSLDHPNIVRFFDHREDGENIYLLSEFVDGCQLREVFEARLSNGRQHPFFSEAETTGILRELLSAVAHCHEKLIVHKDLKPENMMIIGGDEAIKQRRKGIVKLLDFGLAERLSCPNAKSSNEGGTPYYMAPEVLQGQFNHKCDMWGVGVITYWMLTGGMPFEAVTVEEYRKVMECPPAVVFPSGVSQEAQEFVSQLLQVDPDKRPSAVQAVNHKWLREQC
uniref:Kinesin-like protein n=1 Tax=Chromera velia CCMP2878 TaxID=1169474 RepID=A0A0G4FVU8_9ALVE|eukprot:Cvel_3809.t1-p1 / transcript=Cvel_3809.t1 / gene=Cvel_3809 / organism=Chromera_velia_CCMP2878 / gene_product=Calcium-dependent protein kinase 1, putative / transcript_product=Calcium-dependent protein kinase 1, putative / location=Cvel_scaffold160:96360-103551(-) / protein_length=874 / sequence_SO=supercontig / SO=protein_coding / is_pseudo=false